MSDSPSPPQDAARQATNATGTHTWRIRSSLSSIGDRSVSAKGRKSRPEPAPRASPRWCGANSRKPGRGLAQDRWLFAADRNPWPGGLFRRRRGGSVLGDASISRG